jgi:hypothetical protein
VIDAGDSRGPALASVPPWWAWPLLLPGPLLAWHTVVADELARVPDAPAWFGSPALAWAGVGALVFGLAAETLFYAMLWGARGIRMPVVSSALVLLQLSMLEALATGLVQHAPGAGGGLALHALLAGPRAAWAGGGPGGFGSAFGSLGVLTALRMGLWAWTQAEGTGRRWRESAAQVAGVWLASHVAQGWLMELLRGRSAMP